MAAGGLRSTARVQEHKVWLAQANPVEASGERLAAKNMRPRHTPALCSEEEASADTTIDHSCTLRGDASSHHVLRKHFVAR